MTAIYLRNVPLHSPTTRSAVWSSVVHSSSKQRHTLKRTLVTATATAETETETNETSRVKARPSPRSSLLSETDRLTTLKAASVQPRLKNPTESPPCFSPAVQNQNKTYQNQYEEDLDNWIHNNETHRFPLIRHIDIFDFDNTLLKSPVPNTEIWDVKMEDFLKSPVGGRWFQSKRTLAEPYVETFASGFVKNVVNIARTSDKYKSGLTVLLTGRLNTGNRARILKLLRTVDLNFDLICLKEPLERTNEGSATLESTIAYKTKVLDLLLQKLPQVKTMAIWEGHHVRDFRSYLQSKQESGRLNATVVHFVKPQLSFIPYDLECQLVRDLVADYNSTLVVPHSSKAVHPRYVTIQPGNAHFTGYLLDSFSVRRLLSHFPPPDASWRINADHLTICAGPGIPSIIGAAGGIGQRVELIVTHYGIWQESVCAVRVRRSDGDGVLKFQSEFPHITLAYNHRAGIRPLMANHIPAENWTALPIDKQITLNAVIGNRCFKKLGVGHP